MFDQYLKALTPLAVGLILIVLSPILNEGDLAKYGLALVASSIAVFAVPNQTLHGLPDHEVEPKPDSDQGDKGAV